MRISTKGSHDHIGEAVAIDIAGVGDRKAAVVTRRHAIEPEASAAVKAREINGGGKARGLAEHHIARSGGGPVRTGALGTDDHIGEAVAIDIAGTRDRIAALVSDLHPVEPESIAAVEGGEIDDGGETRGLAEYHIARS